MKEIRGLETLKYAEETGLSICLDYNFLAQRETEIQGRQISVNEIDSIIEEAIGEESIEHGEAVVPGTAAYDFLMARHGDQWMIVPLEGNHPENEEAAVMRSFEAFVDAEGVSGGDPLLIHDRYPPQFKDTGFADNGSADLFFHTALRLSAKGKLKQKPDTECYGNTAFYLIR